MGKSLQSKLQNLPSSRKAKIKNRAADLIEQEMTLSDLRSALSKTQITIARKLGMRQEGVSRLEHRTDMLLSTLRKYIRSMGGELKLVAEFPGRPAVLLRGFDEISDLCHK